MNYFEVQFHNIRRDSQHHVSSPPSVTNADITPALTRIFQPCAGQKMFFLNLTVNDCDTVLQLNTSYRKQRWLCCMKGQQ